ncbi:MAG: universal stress protein [Parvibaculum sp.]
MFKSVLVPVDVAHESSWLFALPEALELAKAGGKKVVIMTVVREMTALFEGVYFPFQLEKMMADARQKLTQLAIDFQSPDISIEQEVRFGSIGREILDCAKNRNTDVIVMASHRPEMRDYLIGPNAAHVAQNASCSVLVLRRFT